MSSEVFKLTEIVGTSTESTEAAIRAALARAKESIRGIRWFEVTGTRGAILADGTIEFQVELKLGFAVED